MNSVTLIGTIGAGVILVLFLLNQSNKLKNNTVLYDVGNFLGVALLVVYSLMLKAYPFAVLNAVWALFSLKDVFKDLNKRV